MASLVRGNSNSCPREFEMSRGSREVEGAAFGLAALDAVVDSSRLVVGCMVCGGD